MALSWRGQGFRREALKDSHAYPKSARCTANIRGALDSLIAWINRGPGLQDGIYNHQEDEPSFWRGVTRGQGITFHQVETVNEAYETFNRSIFHLSPPHRLLLFINEIPLKF
jgi:hypothetical protein